MWGFLRFGWLFVQAYNYQPATVKHAQDCAEAIPHSRLWIVENAGHMLPQELPHLFNERMLEFIGELMPQEEKGVQ
jgi:pimeloyl-ACP methyl ester carboxylesterase